VRSCHEYPDWSWDGVRFRFLEAEPGESASTNNRSCILQVLGYHIALLPGDIEALQEGRLLQRYGGALASDILLAPHHGSTTSSSEAFVGGVHPAEVVFTVSYRNRWGFPDRGVQARYRAHGGRLWRSDRDGAIVFTSRRGGLSVEPMRGPPRRIWRRW
jgi:competence protein ComEC